MERKRRVIVKMDPKPKKVKQMRLPFAPIQKENALNKQKAEQEKERLRVAKEKEEREKKLEAERIVKEEEKRKEAQLRYT